MASRTCRATAVRSPARGSRRSCPDLTAPSASSWRSWRIRVRAAPRSRTSSPKRSAASAASWMATPTTASPCRRCRRTTTHPPPTRRIPLRDRAAPGSRPSTSCRAPYAPRPRSAGRSTPTTPSSRRWRSTSSTNSRRRGRTWISTITTTSWGSRRSTARRPASSSSPRR